MNSTGLPSKEPSSFKRARHFSGGTSAASRACQPRASIARFYRRLAAATEIAAAAFPRTAATGTSSGRAGRSDRLRQTVVHRQHEILMGGVAEPIRDDYGEHFSSVRQRHVLRSHAK